MPGESDGNKSQVGAWLAIGVGAGVDASRYK